MFQKIRELFDAIYDFIDELLNLKDPEYHTV
jgi:hypothetical protein